MAMRVSLDVIHNFHEQGNNGYTVLRFSEGRNTLSQWFPAYALQLPLRDLPSPSLASLHSPAINIDLVMAVGIWITLITACSCEFSPVIALRHVPVSKAPETQKRPAGNTPVKVKQLETRFIIPTFEGVRFTAQRQLIASGFHLRKCL